MAKKIQIDVEVNGKMQKATISAKKLRAALDGVEQGYQRAGASAGTYDRRTKGAAQATANGTKEFSKMSQGMGGLVGAYATVAASVFALSAAFNFLKNAADLSAQVKGQEMFAARTGVSMKLMTQNIQEATGGLVAFKEAAQAAAIGQAAGLNADQLERLGRVAKNAGTILGRDVTDSFNRLTRGAIKAEPELLDELGIIVRIKDASEEYAKVIGKSASDLTTFEKSQAVVNAVLEQGETKFQDVGDSVNQVAAFGAKFRDTFKDLAGPIADVSNFFAGAFKDSIFAVSAVFGLLGVSILKSIGISGVAFKDMAAESQMARKRMKKYAGDETKSAIAGEIKKGNFTKRVISDIERASKSKTSKVINFSKVERAALQRDLQIIKAEFLQTAAAGETGFTRMITSWRAQLALFRAESGMVVGTFRALGAAAGAIFSKALSIAAFVGIAVMLVEIGKQFRQAFLISPALSKAEKSTADLSDRLKEQREEITKIKDELKEATSGFNAMAQKLGIVANYNLGPLRGTVAALRKELDATTFNAAGNQDQQFGLDQNQDYIRGRSQIILGDPDALKTVRQFSEAQRVANQELLDARAAFDKANEGLSPFKVGLNRIAAEFGALGDAQRKVDQLDVLGATQGLSNVSDIEEFQVLQEYVDGLREGLPTLSANLSDLSNAGISTGITQDALKGFNAELDSATSLYNSNVINADEYKKKIEQITDIYPELINQIGEGNERAAASKAAFGAISNAVRAFGDASDKFMPNQSNFTAVYQAIDEIDQSINTLVTNMAEVNANDPLSKFLSGPGGDEEAASFRSALRLLNQIKSVSEDYVEITEDSITLEGLRNELTAERVKFANEEFILERKATQNKINQIARLRSATSFEKDITSAKTAQEDAVLNLEKAEAELQNKLRLTLDLSDQQKQALQDAIDLARAELGIAEDKLRLEQLLLPIKRAQAELSVDNKILQAQRDINTGLEKELRLRNEIAGAREDRARRGIQTEAAERSAANPFFDSQAFVAQQTAELERSLVDQKITAAQEEYNAKVLSIGMEFDLLKAKRLQTQFELEALAAKLDDENRGQEADEVRAIANAYGPAMAKVNQSARDQALELAGINYRSTVEQIEETVRGAERTRDALEPLNEILEEAGKVFESSLGTAFDKVFQATYDKTMDLGEELKKVGRDFVTQLQKKLTEKFIIEPLMEKIGGVFGDLFEQDDTGTKIKTALDTGGDALAQKIQAALGYAPTAAYESPTQVGMAHSRDFVGEAAASRAQMEALFSTDATTQAGVPAYGTPSANVQGILNAPVQAQSLQQSTMASFAPMNTSFTPTTGIASMDAPSGVAGDLTVSSPTLPGEGGGGLSSAMENLGTKVSELTLETTGNITAAGAMLAGLTGNEKAAQALATVTALLQVAQLVRNAFIPAETAADAAALASEQFNSTNIALNTGALAANTTAVGALTAAVLVDAATPLTKFGGIVSGGKLMPSYNDGGIGKGPKSGYMVEMHGTEAVVPLPNGKSIPVQLEGAGGTMQNNNVVVNVSVNNDGTAQENAQSDQGEDAKQMGRAISLAVQREIKNQRRAGGMLSPYGGA